MPSGAAKVLSPHYVTGQPLSAQHLLPRSAPSTRPESLQGFYRLASTWRQRLNFAFPCEATIWHSSCFCDFGSSAILPSHPDSFALPAHWHALGTQAGAKQRHPSTVQRATRAAFASNGYNFPTFLEMPPHFYMSAPTDYYTRRGYTTIARSSYFLRGP